MLMPAMMAVSAGVQARPSSGGRAKQREPAEHVVMRNEQEADEVVAEMRAHGGAEIACRVDEQCQQRGEGADRDQHADVHAEHGRGFQCNAVKTSVGSTAQTSGLRKR